MRLLKRLKHSKKARKILRKIALLLFIAWCLQFNAIYQFSLTVKELLRLVLRYSFRSSLEIEEIGRIETNSLYVMIDILSILLPSQLIKLKTNQRNKYF